MPVRTVHLVKIKVKKVRKKRKVHLDQRRVRGDRCLPNLNRNFVLFGIKRLKNAQH